MNEYDYARWAGDCQPQSFGVNFGFDEAPDVEV